MRIAGFQPLSLLDYPGAVCAVVFTQGCPLRCVYCHNPELIPIRRPDAAREIAEADVLRRLERRRTFLDGVCVTGGEPTIHPDLPSFLSRLKALGLKVKLDTNGTHPRMVERVIREGRVDFIAMDLKHVWSRYAGIAGKSQPAIVANCRETAELIRSSGLPHEFRTTVYPEQHAEDDLVAIAESLGAGDAYALQAIRYAKTLVPDLPRTRVMDLEAVAERIRLHRPEITVEVRA